LSRIVGITETIIVIFIRGEEFGSPSESNASILSVSNTEQGNLIHY
jgi:hypothetical protein